MITQRERNLKAKGYRYDCGAADHYSALLKSRWFREHGYFATIVTEQRCGIYYYSVWTKPKKVEKSA